MFNGFLKGYYLLFFNTKHKQGKTPRLPLSFPLSHPDPALGWPLPSLRASGHRRNTLGVPHADNGRKLRLPFKLAAWTGTSPRGRADGAARSPGPSTSPGRVAALVWASESGALPGTLSSSSMHRSRRQPPSGLQRSCSPSSPRTQCGPGDLPATQGF